MPEVLNSMKPDPETCVCGCGLVGTLRTKTWKDGTKHVRLCLCRICAGGRHKGKSRRRENAIAKATDGIREPLSGALSGVDGRAGMWTWEETSQESIVRGLRSWWQGKGVQAKVARLLNRHGEAHAFIASWDGKPQLVVVPFDDWAGQVRDDADFRGGAA